MSLEWHMSDLAMDALGFHMPSNLELLLLLVSLASFGHRDRNVPGHVLLECWSLGISEKSSPHCPPHHHHCDCPETDVIIRVIKRAMRNEWDSHTAKLNKVREDDEYQE